MGLVLAAGCVAGRGTGLYDNRESTSFQGLEVVSPEFQDGRSLQPDAAEILR